MPFKRTLAIRSKFIDNFIRVYFVRFSVNHALSMLETDIPSTSTKADLYMLPPNTVLSDEDSDAEDNPESMNHLSGKQLAAPAEVVFHVSQQTEVDNGNVPDDDSAVFLPPSKKRARKQASQPRKWVSQDIMTSREYRSAVRPSYVFKDWTPVQCFELFFDDEVIDYIALQSVIYAKQCGNHNFCINSGEVRVILAILLLSGYSRVPRRDMYWEQAADVRNEAVATAISHNRFRECLRYLHLADNQNLDPNDRYAKVRPLFTALNEKWLQYFPTENYLSIDESMIEYFGRNGLKQHIHGKPIRFGYKVWSLCTPRGYLVQAEPYQGANTNNKLPELGMGGSVVADLISELPDHTEYSLFFDNLFTSLPLLDYLSSKKIGGTGTIRNNRIGKNSLTDPKEMKALPRGSHDVVTELSSGIALVRWHDNSIVTVASNCLGAFPLASAKRWSQSEKKDIEVEQPHSIQMYNKYMGGVDRLDQNVNKLRIGIRMKKWWWPLFSWMLNVSVQNAWRVYRDISQDQQLENIDMLQFTRRIVQYYLATQTLKKRSGVTVRCRILPEIRYDEKNHLIVSVKKQIRCALCQKKVQRMWGKVTAMSKIHMSLLNF